MTSMAKADNTNVIDLTLDDEASNGNAVFQPGSTSMPIYEPIGVDICVDMVDLVDDDSYDDDDDDEDDTQDDDDFEKKKESENTITVDLLDDDTQDDDTQDDGTQDDGTQDDDTQDDDTQDDNECPNFEKNKENESNSTVDLLDDGTQDDDDECLNFEQKKDSETNTTVDLPQDDDTQDDDERINFEKKTENGTNITADLPDDGIKDDDTQNDDECLNFEKKKERETHITIDLLDDDTQNDGTQDDDTLDDATQDDDECQNSEKESEMNITYDLPDDDTQGDDTQNDDTQDDDTEDDATQGDECLNSEKKKEIEADITYDLRDDDTQDDGTQNDDTQNVVTQGDGTQDDGECLYFEKKKESATNITDELPDDETKDDEECLNFEKKKESETNITNELPADDTQDDEEWINFEKKKRSETNIGDDPPDNNTQDDEELINSEKNKTIETNTTDDPPDDDTQADEEWINSEKKKTIETNVTDDPPDYDTQADEEWTNSEKKKMSETDITDDLPDDDTQDDEELLNFEKKKESETKITVDPKGDDTHDDDECLNPEKKKESETNITREIKCPFKDEATSGASHKFSAEDFRKKSTEKLSRPTPNSSDPVNFACNTVSKHKSREKRFVARARASESLPIPTENCSQGVSSMKIKMENFSSGRFAEFSVVVADDTYLYDAVYESKGAKDANVQKFDETITTEVTNNTVEIKCVVWNEASDAKCHEFSIQELKTTSTKQLSQLVPESTGLVKLFLKAVKKQILEKTQFSATAESDSNTAQSSASSLAPPVYLPRSAKEKAKRKHNANSKSIGKENFSNAGTTRKKELDIESQSNRCNFVIIESSDDDSGPVEYLRTTHKRSKRPETISFQTTSAFTGFSRSHQKAPPQTANKKCAPPSRAYYNSSMSQESAMEMQERLFEQAAARARLHMAQQKAFAAQQKTFAAKSPITGRNQFSVPVLEFAEKHPDHWTWREPYACLGLPVGASLKLVKTHYRKLALIYHPDKSQASSSSDKFHAVTTAYRKLTNCT